MTNEKMPFEMQKHFAESGLEPIKSLVQGGFIHENEATAMIAQATGNFTGQDASPEYKKFQENSKLLFKGEADFPASYATLGDGYNYRASSKNDVPLLFKLYEHLKGKDFTNQTQLRTEMQRLLKDKRILELGCGPGFLVKVLDNLGAQATGLELRTDYKGRIPKIDIRYGNAVHLDELCKDESFDAIISNDVFATACITREDSTTIAKKMYDRTKENGLGIHVLAYEKMSLPLVLFRSWMLERKGLESWKDWTRNMNEEEIENTLWTNECSLDPQYLLRAGFRLDEYKIDGGNLTIVATKQGGSA